MGAEKALCMYSQIAVEVKSDQPSAVTGQDDAVPHLRDDGLVALNVSVRGDLETIIDIEAIVAPAAG